MIIKLVRKQEVAEGTMSFYFEKPKDFDFKAGQSIDLYLINPLETDEEGNKRAYSIAAAPYETDLMITTRLRDTAFKRVLKSLPLGSELEFEGPFGSMTLHNNASKPAVFLAGGIGITPFRSMALQAAHNKLPHKIFLFYSNRRPEDAAFLDELQNIKNPNYKLVATMTDMQNSKQKWSGETGYIDQAMLNKYLYDLHSPIFYMAGPPAMVKAIQDMLLNAGIDSDNIRFEEFTGY